MSPQLFLSVIMGSSIICIVRESLYNDVPASHTSVFYIDFHAREVSLEIHRLEERLPQNFLSWKNWATGYGAGTLSEES